MWPPILRHYLAHPGVMVPGIVGGFVIAGLLMQYFTPDPDEHSTEEVIRSSHEHQGDIQMRPFVPKLFAAIATVGFGGSPEPFAAVRMAAFIAGDYKAPLTAVVFMAERPDRFEWTYEEEGREVWRVRIGRIA